MSYFEDLSAERKAELQREFESKHTTEERRIELLTYLQEAADEAEMSRPCPRCKHRPFFAPFWKTLIEGHVYSHDGMEELKITGYCEFCFDLVTEESHSTLDDSTLCLNCGEPLGFHIWSQAQASSLCPTGDTEFNPA